jgi:hypothetical protein
MLFGKVLQCFFGLFSPAVRCSPRALGLSLPSGLNNGFGGAWGILETYQVFKT